MLYFSNKTPSVDVVEKIITMPLRHTGGKAVQSRILEVSALETLNITKPNA